MSIEAEVKVRLDYAAPAHQERRSRRPAWLNVVYLVAGIIVLCFGGLCVFDLIDLFTIFGHLEFLITPCAGVVLVVIGIVFMTKGLALFEESSNQM